MNKLMFQMLSKTKQNTENSIFDNTKKYIITSALLHLVYFIDKGLLSHSNKTLEEKRLMGLNISKSQLDSLQEEKETIKIVKLF